MAGKMSASKGRSLYREFRKPLMPEPAETLEQGLERVGGPPGDDPADRLRHTLAVYEGDPDDREVLTATRNVYGHGVVTGLTLGDLRALWDRLEAPDAR